MRRRSLRTLLLGSVVLAITVAFSGFAVYIDAVERGNRLDDIDEELRRADNARGGGRPTPGDAGQDGEATAGPADDGSAEAEQQDRQSEAADGQSEAEDRQSEAVDGQSEVSFDPPAQLLVATDGVVLDSQGAPNPFDRATLVALAATEGITSTDEPRYRTLSTFRDDGAVSVTAISLGNFDDAVRRFRTALVLGGAVVLALVAGVLWILTGVLARPVTQMAEAAKRIADGDLGTPVGSRGGSRETTQLADDLDRMLLRLRSAIRQSDQSRISTERLLADMAHEIRTPLTGLKGYSDLYAQGMLADKADVDRAMGRIGSESQRLSDLANGMLLLAKEGSSATETEWFDLCQLLEDTMSDLRAAYPGQQIDLRCDSKGPQVLGSPSSLHRAVLNLGSNACHHSPAGQPVVAVVRSEGDRILVSISDRGPGVAPDDRERVFLPFYRSEAARERTGQQGAGLGLAMTHQIVRQHGGSVWVEETPGGGATFVVSLPRAAESA